MHDIRSNCPITALLTGDCTPNVADPFNCELLISEGGFFREVRRRSPRTKTAYDDGYQIPGAGFDKLVDMDGRRQREEDGEDDGGC